MTTFHDMLEEIKCAKINEKDQSEFCSVNLKNSDEGTILLLFISVLLKSLLGDSLSFTTLCVITLN